MVFAQAIQKLGDLYAKQKDAEALRRLLTDLRPLFASIPKAKTAKIVRTIIETIAKVPNSTQLQVCDTRPRCYFYQHPVYVTTFCRLGSLTS